MGRPRVPSRYAGLRSAFGEILARLDYMNRQTSDLDAIGKNEAAPT